MLYPIRRALPADLNHAKFEDLVDMAILRICDAAIGFEQPPPRLFPMAETVQGTYYTYEDWETHGNMELEMGRTSYMLSKLPERGIPDALLCTLMPVISSDQVLKTWKLVLIQLLDHIDEEIRGVKLSMIRQKSQTAGYNRKSDFMVTPMEYRTGNEASKYGSELWERSLHEIAFSAAKGNFEHVREFLQISAFLRDPLGGLKKPFDKAISIFTQMMTFLADFSQTSLDRPITQLGWRYAAAQASQEAIFLVSPLLEDISYVHFTCHQQLPYAYVRLDQLPRSEFSKPLHVLQMIEDILISKSPQSRDNFSVAPVAVASYPSLSEGSYRLQSVIIDGNHRATAIMVLRLFAEYPLAVTTEDFYDMLHKFCYEHGLGRKWNVDLADVIEHLHDSAYYTTLVKDRALDVQQFREIEQIPALVVEEDNFHTACLQRPGYKTRPRLLLPIHQAIYNDDKLGFAFPQSGQVHGRTMGFKSLPLIRSPGNERVQKFLYSTS